MVWGFLRRRRRAPSVAADISGNYRRCPGNIFCQLEIHPHKKIIWSLPLGSPSWCLISQRIFQSQQFVEGLRRKMREWKRPRKLKKYISLLYFFMHLFCILPVFFTMCYFNATSQRQKYSPGTFVRKCVCLDANDLSRWWFRLTATALPWHGTL